MSDLLVTMPAERPRVSDLLSCFVPGTPAPQGSMRAFTHRRTGRPIVTSDNAHTRPWRDAVAAVAVRKRSRWAKRSEAVAVIVQFRFDRPQSHRAAKGLRPSAPREHVVRPDVDKLLRAVLDALTGVVLIDDAQVSWVSGSKRYCMDNEIPGAQITARVVT